MNKGGYQIIDLKNKNFTLGTGMVVEGAYEKIDGTNKPIYISGICIAGVEYHDTYVNFVVKQTNFEGLIHVDSIYKIVIQDNDVITISKATA